MKRGDMFSIWLFNNMIWLSFYAGVPLLFGLVLIRVNNVFLCISFSMYFYLLIACLININS